MMMKKLATALSLGLLAAGFAHAEETTASAYGTLRIGVDNVNAGTSDDGMNGRDYLSAVGMKAAVKMDNGLTGVGQVEYGLRDENTVDIAQMGQPTLRLAFVGLKGAFGEVYYGSQTPLWHKYVRSAYFSDGNDTVRLGTVREDDLTQYYFKGENFNLGAGIHTEGQEGDSLDSWSVGGEYKAGPATLQAAYTKDERGANTGGLLGVRAWYAVTDALTLSAYFHQADDDFDLYGGSSGNVALTEAAVSGSVKGIGNCAGEERTNQGVYAAYKIGAGKVHARYAIDSCEDAGDVTSSKVEYVYYLAKNYNVWASYEALNNDSTRMPATGKEMSEAQLGVRFDF
ncbi:porin [Thalassolituus sp. LLYu03]|uniref:porin n=1 Tax=Thalassolituus sp. LLYu03 TaxID=3421656 RepID=UPI003D27304B